MLAESDLAMSLISRVVDGITSPLARFCFFLLFYFSGCFGFALLSLSVLSDIVKSNIQITCLNLCVIIYITWSVFRCFILRDFRERIFFIHLLLDKLGDACNHKTYMCVCMHYSFYVCVYMAYVSSQTTTQNKTKCFIISEFFLILQRTFFFFSKF